MLKVTEMLTKYNHDKASGRKIKYIVIHWVGAASTAVNNGTYFQGGDRGASAHYFVNDTHIVKSVREKETSPGRWEVTAFSTRAAPMQNMVAASLAGAPIRTASASRCAARKTPRESCISQKRPLKHGGSGAGNSKSV